MQFAGNRLHLDTGDSSCIYCSCCGGVKASCAGALLFLFFWLQVASGGGFEMAAWGRTVGRQLIQTTAPKHHGCAGLTAAGGAHS